MGIVDKIKRIKKPKAPWAKYYKGKGTIETPDKSLYDYFEERALTHPNAIAYDYFGTQKTYHEFLKEIDNIAKAYKSIGIRPGDVVTILMPNTPESIASFFAINKIGAISNMVHPLSGEEEIKYYIESTHSVVLLSIDMCYDKIKNILGDTDIYKVIFASVGSSMPIGLKLGYRFTKGRKIKTPKKDIEYILWKDFIKGSSSYSGKYHVHTKASDKAVILHSGGTTGTPKGIVIPNRCFTSLIEQAQAEAFNNVGVGDSMLSILPIFHGFGLEICIYLPLCIGAKAIIRPAFDANKFDKLLMKTRPSCILGVPTLYEALTNTNNKKLDLSNLKWIISGGDSLKPALEDRINEFIASKGARCTLSQGYGMTESLGATVFAYRENNKKGSLGIPLPSNYVKIVIPGSQEEVPTGEDGEICITGPTVMDGYLDNEVDNNSTLQKHSDGYIWLHTGDIGYIDSDGVIFYKQRLKRMIISSGYNIYPNQIEEVIERHPAVLKCTVIGIPHKYKMEVAKAYIVLKDGYTKSLTIKNEIKELCKKNLAVYSVPKEFEFRNSLPNTLLGKVDYKKLEKENNDEE